MPVCAWVMTKTASWRPSCRCEQLNEGGLDLVVAGRKSGVMMVEAGADEVDEKAVAEGIEFAFKAIQPAIKLQEELVEKIGVTKQEYELSLPDPEIQKAVDEWLEGKLGEDLRKPYPERNEFVQSTARRNAGGFRRENGRSRICRIAWPLPRRFPDGSA